MSPGPTPVALAWAAVLGALALLSRLSRPGGAVRRRALRLVGDSENEAGRLFERWLREGAGWVRRMLADRPGVVCLPVGLAVGLVTRSPLPVAAGVAGAPLLGRAWRRRRARAAAERGLVAVSTLCGTVAGDLRAGRPPHVALAEAVESAGWAREPELTGAARLMVSAARFGGDVPRALRAASQLREGTRGLAAVAACWQVAVDGGAGLAAALDRVAAALRAEADQRDDLRAQLAGPRSTAVMLALLPLFGLVLGTGLGAHPSAVLLHTPAGIGCLLVGAALEWAGLAWTARIIREAENGPGSGEGWTKGAEERPGSLGATPTVEGRPS
ncbi:type II secretion system F family protein [Streptomyces sp. NBC_01190]|uniref:type II secretion system F family protein n=1 Tax=Streptomyces sp. NBC_01190 TaxID=2903767 RepID=UPI003864A80D|nr:type II secretion system F family protein [Streptomyces sp. NBC_01190]